MFFEHSPHKLLDILIMANKIIGIDVLAEIKVSENRYKNAVMKETLLQFFCAIKKYIYSKIGKRKVFQRSDAIVI